MDERLAVLIAKDEITDVVHRVARGTDRLDRELIRSGYHADGFDDHNNFRGDPAQFADWVLEVLSPYDYTQHLLGQSRIEVDTPIGEDAVAFGETYCNAHHVVHPRGTTPGHDLRMGLRYIDRFERRAGGPWLIARRVCAFEWRYTLALQTSFEYGADFTVGKRDRTDITYSWRSAQS